MLKRLRESLAPVRQDKGQRRCSDPPVLLVQSEAEVALAHKAEIPVAVGPVVHGALIEVALPKRARSPEVKLLVASRLLVAELLLLLPVKRANLPVVVAEREVPLHPLLQKPGRVRARVQAELEAPAAVVRVERVGDSRPFNTKIERRGASFQGSLSSC